MNPDVLVSSPAIAPAEISWSRRTHWCVRRELWESRSIYLAPLAVAALFLLGFLVSVIGSKWSTLDELALHKTISEPYDFAAGLIMATTFVVAIFYCLDALYGERRDRSVLFWKSLPVSDAVTVLSKAIVPLVILPLVTFVITVVLQLLMTLISTLALFRSSIGIGTLWTHAQLFQRWMILLYHLITVHSLWYAPIFGGLIMVSAWARRTPFLWASLPLIAIGFIEKVAFNTRYFVGVLESRIGGPVAGDPFMASGVPMEQMGHASLLQFLMSSGLWIGLAVTAVFLAAAVRLRRNAGPL